MQINIIIMCKLIPQLFFVNCIGVMDQQMYAISNKLHVLFAQNVPDEACR